MKIAVLWNVTSCCQCFEWLHLRSSCLFCPGNGGSGLLNFVVKLWLHNFCCPMVAYAAVYRSALPAIYVLSAETPDVSFVVFQVCVCVCVRALCTGVLWICECNVAGKSHWIVWLCFHRHDIACRTTVKVICDYARITVTVELCRWLRLPFSVALRHWALAAPCFLWLSQQRWDQLDPLPCRTNKEKTQTSLQD
jgi:hypothetical protein